MKTKTVYSYDPATGEYIGETIAHESPLEKGVYLIPAYATETAPAEPSEHEATVWIDGKWTIVEDWRGCEGYANGEPTVIETLGPLPEGWSETPPEPSLDELQAAKIAEIRAAALDKGRAGASIIGSVAPYLAYKMALTPDDVAYLKLANDIAKAEADMLGIPHAEVTAEIKEKWLDEDGVERTQLHPSVPRQVHDAVLMQAILQAKEITRRQEILIQAVLDAGTPEAVAAINWNTPLEVM